MSQKIAEFEITGTFDHTQYWTGVGVAFTDWTEVKTGWGTTNLTAYDEAIEALASDGWDTSTLPAEIEEERGMLCECGIDDECEHSWIVSVFVR